MNTSRTVTHFPMVKGNLEWDLENMELHFQKCSACWTQVTHVTTCPYGQYYKIESPPMLLAAGDGKQSKWHFRFEFSIHRCKFWLILDGLFGSDESKLDEPLTVYCTATAKKLGSGGIGEATLFKFGEHVHNMLGGKDVCLKELYPKELSTFLIGNANLTIKVEVTHFSDVFSQVLNNCEVFNLKDPVPVPLVSCYGNLLNNPDMSDFKINCSGSSFNAHKFILSVRSRVFRTMIESGLSESTGNELKIQDMTAKTVELMLEFIYKGTVENFPEDLKTRIELLDCAEKYQLDELKSICMKQIFSKLPAEKDVGELAMAAFTYGANEKITQVIKEFCIKNHEKLIRNPEYKKLFLSKPQAFVN